MNEMFVTGLLVTVEIVIEILTYPVASFLLPFLAGVPNVAIYHSVLIEVFDILASLVQRNSRHSVHNSLLLSDVINKVTQFVL
jgi:hypothetical protein